MGSVTFTKTYSISGIGSTTVNVKINYSESYSASTNKTTVSLSSIQQAASRNFGNPVVRGAVEFNGTTVVSYPDNSSSYTVSLSSGSTSTYKSWTSKSSSTIQVTHGTDGKANLTIKLLSTNGSSYFGAWYQNKAVGVNANSSETVSLTTHTYSLSVNPNGGTWNGSASSQSFSQAPTSTKTIANPTRTGYTFTGWTLTGGGSFSGTTYTFGSSDGTLTASWTINTWTVEYNANGHGTAPSNQTKTYGTALTLRAFIADQTGSGTTANYTVTGNANGGTWNGSNGSATRTPQYTYSQTYWNTKSDGSGTDYSSQGSYTTNAAATMYAMWKTTTSYTYTYVLPTGTPAKNESVTVTFNANEGSTTKTSQDGTRAMTFSGWYTAASGGTKRTTSSEISASETVYAHYGSGSGSYSSVTMPTASQCTRSGYTLLGFSTSSSATSATYAPGASYTPTASIILYAVWKANGSVHIDDGTSFNIYMIYIDNGTSWDQYIPYIDNGTSWDIYS